MIKIRYERGPEAGWMVARVPFIGERGGRFNIVRAMDDAGWKIEIAYDAPADVVAASEELFDSVTDLTGPHPKLNDAKYVLYQALKKKLGDSCTR